MEEKERIPLTAVIKGVPLVNEYFFGKCRNKMIEAVYSLGGNKNEKLADLTGIGDIDEQAKYCELKHPQKWKLAVCWSEKLGRLLVLQVNGEQKDDNEVRRWGIIYRIDEAFDLCNIFEGRMIKSDGMVVFYPTSKKVETNINLNKKKFNDLTKIFIEADNFKAFLEEP